MTQDYEKHLESPMSKTMRNPAFIAGAVVALALAFGLGAFVGMRFLAVPGAVGIAGEPAATAESPAATPPASDPYAAEQAARAAAAAEEEARFAGNERYCLTATRFMKDAGVLPGNAALTEAEPVPGELQGRYSCKAGAGESTYVIVFDAVCADANNRDCASVFSVTANNGAVLYQRRY